MTQWIAMEDVPSAAFNMHMTFFSLKEMANFANLAKMANGPANLANLPANFFCSTFMASIFQNNWSYITAHHPATHIFTHPPLH